MTTAHRPTFHAAIGGKEQGGGRYIAGVSRQHVHDLGSQMSIKTRQPGQGTADEISKADMRAALEAKESAHLKAIGKGSTIAKRLPPPPPPPMDDDDDDDENDVALLIDPEDADDKPRAGAAEGSKSGGGGGGGGGAADDDSDEESDDDDDEDEEAELMRELERIKKERAAEAAKKASRRHTLSHARATCIRARAHTYGTLRVHPSPRVS